MKFEWFAVSRFCRDTSAECQVLEGQKTKLKGRTQQLVLQAHVLCVHM